MPKGPRDDLDRSTAILAALGEGWPEGPKAEGHATSAADLALQLPEHRLGPWADTGHRIPVWHKPLASVTGQVRCPFQEEVLDGLQAGGKNRREVPRCP